MCDSTLLRAVPAVIGVTVSAVDRLTHGMGNGPKGTAKKVGTALVRRGARIGGWQHTHGCANTGGGPAQRGDGGGSAAPFERALPPR